MHGTVPSRGTACLFSAVVQSLDSLRFLKIIQNIEFLKWGHFARAARKLMRSPAWLFLLCFPLLFLFRHSSLLITSSVLVSTTLTWRQLCNLFKKRKKTRSPRLSPFFILLDETHKSRPDNSRGTPVFVKLNPILPHKRMYENHVSFNLVYTRRVDPSVLPLSLSSHRYSCHMTSILFRSRCMSS